MKSTREGPKLIISIEGAIGETTPLFTFRIAQEKELVLDLDKVTYINSIGVKHWIMWTLRIPKDCQVSLINTPFVIASQASIVLGFVTPMMKLDSIRLPFACDNCKYEEVRTAIRGKDYEYASPGQKAKLPEVKEERCPKCKTGALEGDFLVEKTFKFLG